MAYNYHKAVVADVEEKIREDLNGILEDFKAKNLEEIDRDELKENIRFDVFNDDSVTGNGSGSYFFDSYKSAEALLDNDKLIAEALDFFNDEIKLGLKDREEITEFLDVTVRCYEVYCNCINEAVQNVIDSPDKQVEENEELEVQDYDVNGYREGMNQILEEYVTNNIADILEENNINSVKDYEDGKGNIENFIFQKISTGEMDIPLPSDRDVMHNLEEALGNASLADFDYKVEDYFTNKEVEILVKELYAEDIALEQILPALDETYDKVILPALEQREVEQDIDRD